MGPEHASREKILSMVIFLFLCTKMYIDLDSKRSKSGVNGVLRKLSFSYFSSKENDFPVVKSGFGGHLSHFLGVCLYSEVVLDFRFGHWKCPN